MGVDTHLTLAAGVEVRDIAKAIAILLGAQKTWTDCSQGCNSSDFKHNLTKPTQSGWVEVKGISYHTSDSQPECVTINIEGAQEKFGGGWWFFYHFEFGQGKRGMIGKSRAARIALHCRLAKLFGGTVDFSDCDDKSVDYRAKSPEWVGNSNKNKQFHDKEMALWNLQPMTQADVDKYAEQCAYK